MRPIKLNTMDYLFGALVLAAAISFAMNGSPAGLKETAIFAASVACYPVCRFVSATDHSIAAIGFTSLCIAIVGAFATAIAIFEQWPVFGGKPTVFGSDAAGTLFLMAMGFFTIAAATRKLTRKQTILISAILLVTSTVFAAALVRLTFAAILATLAFSWLLTAGRQRVYISMMAASIILGGVLGTLIRFDKIPILIEYTTETTAYRTETIPLQKPAEPAAEPTKATVQKPPSCLMEVNMYNSIAERKALWRDSLYLIPRAGLFGFGLDGFMKYSCMKGFPPHNSVFQAFVEFGWVGGLALSAMVVFSFIRLVPLARYKESERFIVCALVFAVLLSFAHGRLSRDLVLFSMLGLAASVLRPGDPRRSGLEIPAAKRNTRAGEIRI
jgi:O-antigen ligase